jgi:RHS repeat-associated protein
MSNYDPSASSYRGTNEAEFVSQIRQSGNNALTQFSDRTRWLYDQATGLLTNKLYADGKGPSYSYTALGQLSTRKWARLSTDNCPLITDYFYNSFGSLTNTAYSDGTPSVSFTFDAMGRTKVAQTFLSATGEIISCTTNIYSGLDLVAEIQNGVRIDRQVDAFGRPSGISIGQDYAVEYGFNKYGQFSSVKSVKSAETNLFTYSYLPGSHLIASVDHPSYTARKTYENSRDLITTVSNTFGTATISAFNYENDGLGRRTARTDTTPTLTVNNAFGYNLKSEVTSATMANGDSKYDYDPIGNRVFSSLNAETNTYSANALNQYSSLQPKDLQPINLSYDLDGNMLTNGVWSYSWDAENRLTAVYSNNTLLVSNIYDHQSRRIAKIVSHGGTETQRRDFVYDGWNLIQELITDNGSLTTNFFTWGLDLSGTLQGAGGVGGLLAVTRDSAAFFPCFDANGNVTEYIDATGAIKAHYAFDAFGNTIAQSGALASTFTHRFSTKYFDPETGLYYYGYRFYMPQLGRWLSRDPIGTPGMREWFKNQLRTQSEMQQVLDEISNAEGAVLNKSGGDPKTINALNQYFSVLRQNAVLSSKIWAFPEADPAFTHLYHFCSNDSINRQDSLGEISWLVQGGISVGLGYALAKITDQPYDWKDVAIDFGMGALGPGLLANAKKLATAGKCVKVAGNITVTTKRIAQVIDTVNNRGIVEKAATAVFDARKMQVKLMIEADNKIWEASVGMTSVTARYTGKKLLHGINQASYSETMDASFEYETKGDGNYKLNSTETAPKIEANNWDIQHVDGSLMEIRP